MAAPRSLDGVSGWRWLFVVEEFRQLSSVCQPLLSHRPTCRSCMAYRSRTLGDCERAGCRASCENQVRPLEILDACKDARLLLLVTGYFFYIMAVVTNALWMPTFLQRLSHLPAAAVARLIMVPAAAELWVCSSTHGVRTGWPSQGSSTRKTSGESDLVAALQCGSRIETAREPTTQSLLLSIPVMVPMSCLHFISCSFGGAKD